MQTAAAKCEAEIKALKEVNTTLAVILQITEGKHTNKEAQRLLGEVREIVAARAVVVRGVLFSEARS